MSDWDADPARGCGLMIAIAMGITVLLFLLGVAWFIGLFLP